MDTSLNVDVHVDAPADDVVGNSGVGKQCLAGVAVKFKANQF